MAKRKTEEVAAPAKVPAPKRTGLFVDLTPIAQPGGYPVHGEWVEWDAKGKSTTHNCGGLLMLPEEAGMRSPPVLSAEIDRRFPVACALCSKRSGQPVRVSQELYQKVLAASRAAGVSRGQMGEQTITLGSLGKPARSMLHNAFMGKTQAVKDGPAKGFSELYGHGLVTATNEITEAGKRVAAAAGWERRGAA